MIRVFHGFLGSPEDFSFLRGEDVILHQLSDGVPETASRDILIGYSMGGRLAMELARKNGFSRLVLINAHPGLEDAQREPRKVWEDEVLARLQDHGEFLRWWNSLPLFAADRPLETVPPRSAELFQRMRLSKQENFLPFLRSQNEKVHWILGKDDPKYSELASSLDGFDVQVIPGGHRLFQHPDALHSAIKKALA